MTRQRLTLVKILTSPDNRTHIGGRTLSVAHHSLTIFVALNAARTIAYWPQLVSIYRDPGHASAVSLWTRTVFAAANVSTAIYALAELGDIIRGGGVRSDHNRLCRHCHAHNVQAMSSSPAGLKNACPG